MNFYIDMETPAKKNSRINLRNGRSIPSKRYTEWHIRALAELNPQIREFAISAPITEPVAINLIFTHGDLRRRDSDNGCSSIMDLLVDAGILSDDNWRIVESISIRNFYEKNKPQCRIEITPINDNL